ncbi:MAG TPA: hypothetical protein VES96_04750 [Nitrospiraceae bacterium]|nr:hypothetical protein [Nitrospiraceae bacterium]
MRMLTIACRKYLEDEVQALFSSLEIKGYTLIEGVSGNGTAASATHNGSNRNMLFMVVLDDDQTAGLVNALKELRAMLAGGSVRREVPFKIFLQSCEEIL